LDTTKPPLDTTGQMFFFVPRKTNICRTFGTFDANVQNIWFNVV